MLVWRGQGLWQRPQQQPGLVWMSKAIAQPPTLWRGGAEKWRAGGASGYRPVPHSRCFKCLAEEVPPGPSSPGKGGALRVYKLCGQGTSQ